MSFYEKCRPIAHAVMRFLFRYEVDGTENVPDGPFLLCSNHISFEDVILIGLGVKRQLHFMAKKEIFSVPLLKGLVKKLGAFPVNRGAADVGALRTAIKLLESGESIVIFPQGTRCPGTEPSETKTMTGAAMLAYRTGVPVLPVYLDNKNHRPRIFRRYRVVYGKPIANADLGIENGTAEEYRRAVDLIFDRICSLPRKYSPPKEKTKE